MEPKLNLDELFKNFEDTITISNPGAVTGSLGPYTADTVTLSGLGATYSNTMVSGGGYSVPNVSITSGTGITQPWFTTKATPWLGDGISADKEVGGKLILEGNGADIEINGIGLSERLAKIEERLNILRPNKKMEAEWDQLRELGNQYRALESKLTEQGEMWDKLKAMAPPDIG